MRVSWLDMCQLHPPDASIPMKTEMRKKRRLDRFLVNIGVLPKRPIYDYGRESDLEHTGTLSESAVLDTLVREGFSIVNVSEEGIICLAPRRPGAPLPVVTLQTTGDFIPRAVVRTALRDTGIEWEQFLAKVISLN